MITINPVSDRMPYRPKGNYSDKEKDIRGGDTSFADILNNIIEKEDGIYDNGRNSGHDSGIRYPY